MKTEDFDYELPKELIAQTPLTKRDESRLLVLERKTGNITHDIFHNIVDYLNNGDVLVLNNSKVIPARLFGIKEKTNAVIEMLLLREIKDHIWETLVKPARRIKLGTIINFNDKLKAKCIKILEEGRMEFELFYDGILYEILNALGEMPLPPYITVKLNEKNRYQTIYAKHEGSAAAPTAGLHFTNELLTKIKRKVYKSYTLLYI